MSNKSIETHLKDAPLDAVSSHEFMSTVLALLPRNATSENGDALYYALDRAYEDLAGVPYTHYEVEGYLITIYLAIPSAERFRKHSNSIADFMLSASRALFGTQYCLSLNVTLYPEQDSREKVKTEHYRVATKEGMTVRSAHTSRGFAQESYSSPREAFRKAFTAIGRK